MPNRISNLVNTGLRLKQQNTIDNESYLFAKAKNQWFPLDFIMASIDAIVDTYLNEAKLNSWLTKYNFEERSGGKSVGIIMAGNIPLVGIHDFICAYIQGFHIQVKLSSKDEVLMLYFLQILGDFDTGLKEQMSMVQTLKNVDAVIATGSDNSNRYFEYYFKSIPSILRKNRNSVAILNGDESATQLEKLADDIFMFFGLGCRNVSKLYVPSGYDLTMLFPHFKKYEFLHQHSKFMNNYDYNRTLLLMNATPHLANDFCMLREDSSFASRIAELHYQFYNDLDEVAADISLHQDQIQCVLADFALATVAVLPLGSSQSPSLSDYADNVDTMAFLKYL